MRRRFDWVLILLFLSVSSCAHTGFDDGSSDFTKGDYSKAYKEYKVLADQDDANAQFNLGLMYLNGQKVPQDYAEAEKWFRKAADQGHSNAQFNLGLMYYMGQKVPQDYTEAAKWFRKAADQGDASAQFFLGRMYMLGRGLPKDNVKAHMWFNLAAARGHLEAKNYRDSTAKKMTLSQIAKAQRLAREWKPKVKKE
jgi:hypothetical protein